MKSLIHMGTRFGLFVKTPLFSLSMDLRDHFDVLFGFHRYMYVTDKVIEQILTLHLI